MQLYRPHPPIRIENQGGGALLLLGLIAAGGVGAYYLLRDKDEDEGAEPSIQLAPNIFHLTDRGQFLTLIQAIQNAGLQDVVGLIYRDNSSRFIDVAKQLAPAHTNTAFLLVDDRAVEDLPTAGLSAACEMESGNEAAVTAATNAGLTYRYCFQSTPTREALETAAQDAVATLGS